MPPPCAPQIWQIGTPIAAHVTATLSCDSTLTISGMGAMKNFGGSDLPPWNYFKNSIKTLVINKGVTNIGDFAFSVCEQLNGSLNIPNGVTAIGKGAFNDCSGISDLTIPASAANIEELAFGNCDALISVTNFATTPQIITNEVFHNVNLNSATLYVPCGGSLSAYQATEGWSDFGNYVELLDAGSTTIFANATVCENELPYNWRGRELYSTGTYTDTIVSSASCDSVFVLELTLNSQRWQIGSPVASAVTAILCGNTLTISGAGAMQNFANSTSVPWHNDITDITNLVIEEGVTSIGNYVFSYCSGLTSLNIPN